ncbi:MULTISPECIES: response regulator transcription factor [Butyricimonas]|uniref:response regulator transcription factor n=1 Tax=Butyricimonas TaxID=574697 RepID=UPI0007FB508F|nr:MULTISPECIES: helix-turn-helix transcriptional regulator [Butyricimonas]
MNTLTNREIEIADYIAWGASVDEAADRLNISPFTVKNTLRNIYAKLHFNKSTELAAYMFVKHPERMTIDNDKIGNVKRAVSAMTMIALIFMQLLIQPADMMRARRARTRTARRTEYVEE